jgi:putative ABC transport system substrate-binding protein
MTSRRHLLAAFGAVTLAQPFALLAQQPPKIRRVGVLWDGARPADLSAESLGAFPRGMRELGYVEGKNLVIEWRFADGKIERLPELATDLVRANVEVMVSTSTNNTHALQKATSTIPIVMTTVADPVGRTFVKSLARPGGNITGLSNMLFELRAKQLEMLHSVTPKLARMAALFNPNSPANFDGIKILEDAAKKLGVRVVSLEAHTAQHIENAFARMAKESIQAILVVQDTVLFQSHRHQIAESAMKLRLPSIASTQAFAEAGVLMSYGANVPDIYRRAATYVDKILKGANPAELPIEQPMRFDLVVNMKTARALGLKLPDEIMVRAERLIE